MKLFKNQKGFNDVVVMTIIGGIIGSLFIAGVFVYAEIEQARLLNGIFAKVSKVVKVDKEVNITKNIIGVIDKKEGGFDIISGNSNDADFKEVLLETSGNIKLIDKYLVPDTGIIYFHMDFSGAELYNAREMRSYTESRELVRKYPNYYNFMTFRYSLENNLEKFRVPDHIIDIRNSSDYSAYHIIDVSPEGRYILIEQFMCHEGGGCDRNIVFDFENDSWKNNWEDIGSLVDFEWLDDGEFRYKQTTEVDCPEDYIQDEHPYGCYLKVDELDWIVSSV